jgi:uncharacterized protein (TIGR02996 family)
VTPEALLAEVLASPQDDTPRLVYADWLEEEGEVWAADLRREGGLLKVLPDGNVFWRLDLIQTSYLLGRAPAATPPCARCGRTDVLRSCAAGPARLGPGRRAGEWLCEGCWLSGITFA